MLNEPAEFPEGTEIELVALADGDDLDDEARVELPAALDQGLAEQDDEGVDAADLIAELRARR